MYIRTKDGRILETQTTSKCIYVIRNKNVDGKNCYVTYLWDNWEKYHLIDFQNCVLFSYNSAQNFISDLMKENLNYQDLVIEISPYYKNCEQADTIEELCDMFVVIENVYGKIYHSINYTLCDDLRNDKDNGGVYGAVWTSKGLIYVAKMNDKGELVLI
jgi:hypothetical protein